MRLVLACLAVIALVVGIIRGTDADGGPSEGVRLTYEMDLAGVSDPDAALTAAISVIHARIGQRGFPVRIHRHLDNGIAVELPGLSLDELAAVQDLITRRAQLEFRIADAGADYMRTLAERVHYDTNAGARSITAEVDPDVRSATYQAWYLKAPDREEELEPDEARRIGCFEPPVDGKHRCRVRGRDVIERYVLLDPNFAVPADRELVYELITSDTGRPSWRTHYLERAAVLTGAALKTARVIHDSTVDRPQVLLELTPDAAVVFGEVTAREVGHRFAIVVDGRVISAPIVEGPITRGEVAITMGTTDRVDQQRQAEALVAALRGGSLPAPLQLAFKEPFTFPGRSFINRSWMFFVAAALLAGAALAISLRGRRRSRAGQGVSAETPS